MIAWEYGPIAAGALSVCTVFIIEFPFHEHFGYFSGGNIHQDLAQLFFILTHRSPLVKVHIQIIINNTGNIPDMRNCVPRFTIF